MNLPQEANDLLLEAAEDRDGLIVKLTAAGGSAHLKSNGRRFGDGTPGEQARWASAIRRLVGLGLIEPAGSQVYCITHEGRRAADVLRGR